MEKPTIYTWFPLIFLGNLSFPHIYSNPN
jgi:hypothetical protein